MTRRLSIAFCGLLSGLTAASSAPHEQDLRQALLAEPLTAKLGGDTTRLIASAGSFTFLIENAAPGRARVFSFGNRIFNTNWVQAPASVKAFDGLGPVFNRVSCAGCHTFDGRGRPPETEGGPMDSILVRLSVPGEGPHGGPKPHPAYGDQLNELAIQGVKPEGKTTIRYTEIPGTFGDGEPYTLRKPALSFTELAYGSLDGALTSLRVAPQIIGMGLLESVPDATLEELADPDDEDGDGISGRVNPVWSEAAGGAVRIGRFGWKANAASLEDQSANAALGDIGLTTPLHRYQNCTEAAVDCAAAYAQPASDGPEISVPFFAKLLFYTRAIAVPKQRNERDAEVVRGQAAFRAAGCADCHMPTLKTGAIAVEPELANQTFHPFTDLLLHDMGEGLADGRPDYAASESEWRTPPLWGLGLIHEVNGHTLLLHDGRARGFAEAILWHGGEGEAAKERFRTMPKDERQALIAFLESL
ncbi:MAG: c-type cytochrome [Alphaproteobacteria bacterium]|nr:c-type cytochrome [Alphaproteobacteria bacterium]